MVAQATSGLELSELDPALRYFCEEGLAVSTRKTYHSALKGFTAFCSLYSILSPFPVSESLLCYFSSYLVCQNVSPQTIKHISQVLGIPELHSACRTQKIFLSSHGCDKCKPAFKRPMPFGLFRKESVYQ